MAPFKVHHSVDYPRLNSEAQRRYTARVGSPCLVWHLAIWPDHDRHPLEVNSWREHLDHRARFRDEVVNEFIRRLCGPKHRLFEMPPPRGRMGWLIRWVESLARGASRSGSSVIRAFRLPLAWAARKLRVGLASSKLFSVRQDVLRLHMTNVNGERSAIIGRVELHGEYATFSFFLPIDPEVALGRPPKPRPTTPRKDESILIRSIPPDTDEDVDRIVLGVWSQVGVLDDEEKEKKDLEFMHRAAPHWAKLYEDAWETAFAKVETVASVKRSLELRGCMFTNIRGIVLPREWMRRAVTPPDRAKPSEFKLTDLKSDQIRLDDYGDRYWNTCEAGDLLHRNLALRHAMHWGGGEPSPTDDNDPARQRRTVANLVLDGQALFAACVSGQMPEQDQAAGAKPPPWFGDPTRTAGRFAVFYAGQDLEESKEWWQLLNRRLDRLVQRLTSLATTRILALKDLDSLWHAGAELRLFMVKIMKLSQAGGFGRKSSERRYQRRYMALNRIVRQTTGGIAYRISRSSYYARDFDRTLTDVNPIRIEGWESYGVFVRRRLYLQFDNINQIGERAEEARARVDRLAELHIASNTSRQTTALLILTIVLIADAMFSGSSADAWLDATLDWLTRAFSKVQTVAPIRLSQTPSWLPPLLSWVRVGEWMQWLRDRESDQLRVTVIAAIVLFWVVWLGLRRFVDYVVSFAERDRDNELERMETLLPPEPDDPPLDEEPKTNERETAREREEA